MTIIFDTPFLDFIKSKKGVCLNRKVVNTNYISRSSIRSFSDIEQEEAADVVLETRTIRAREAVRRAQEIVIKNNAMAAELRKSSGFVYAVEDTNSIN